MPEANDPSKAPMLVDISVLKKAGVYSTKNNNNGRDSVRGIQNISMNNHQGAHSNNHRSPKNQDVSSSLMGNNMVTVTINNKVMASSGNSPQNNPPHGKMLSTATSHLSNVTQPTVRASGKFGEVDAFNPGATLQADGAIHHSHRGGRDQQVRMSNTTNGTKGTFLNQKLKMQDVRNLSEDADQVIDSLKGVDYGMQELDVLIELSR